MRTPLPSTNSLNEKSTMVVSTSTGSSPGTDNTDTDTGTGCSTNGGNTGTSTWVVTWVVTEGGAGPVSWDTEGPPCMGTAGNTGGCAALGSLIGPLSGPSPCPSAGKCISGTGVGLGGGVASALGSKESVLSSDILPKENNGFTRKIFV